MLRRICRKLTTCLGLAVLVRLIIRFIVIRNPGADDFTIILAILLTLGYLIVILIDRDNHVGFPATDLTTDEMLTQVKLTLAIEVIYYMIVGSIKTSILYMYLRFGKLRPRRW